MSGGPFTHPTPGSTEKRQPRACATETPWLGTRGGEDSLDKPVVLDAESLKSARNSEELKIRGFGVNSPVAVLARS